MVDVYEKPKFHLWAEVVLSVLAVCGLILNLKVARIVYHASIGPDIVIMRLIVLFDIITCVFTFPYQYLRLTYQTNPFWCQIDLIIFSTSTFASLIATSSLSLIRYLILVRGYNLKWRYCATFTLLYILIIWITIVIRSFVQDYIVMPSGMYCMPHVEHASFISIFIDSLYILFLLPCPIIILFGYIAVAIKYGRIVENQTNEAALLTCGELATSPTIAKQIKNSVNNRQNLKHRHNIIKLILVTVAYLIAITPEYYLSLATIFSHFFRSVYADYVAFLLLFSVSLINPIFIIHTHEPNLRPISRNVGA